MSFDIVLLKKMNGTTKSLNSSNCRKFSAGDTGFGLLNSALFFLMLPGFGFYYSGHTHIGSSITMLMTSMWTVGVVSIQWWLVGYSLSFSKTSSPIFGDLSHAFLQRLSECEYPIALDVPELVFSFYQGIAAMMGPSILLGAIADRGRTLPAVLFVCLWTTLVYDPICAWTLNPRGWLFRLGLLDYGGSSPLHVPAAVSAITYSKALGPLIRRTNSRKPESIFHVILGTMLVWFGSYGNNAGAAMQADLTSIFSVMSVTLSATSGAVTWGVLDYWKYRKLTVVGYCAGAVGSLVSITSCAGFVSPFSSLILGILTSIASYIGFELTEKYKWNDALEVFALHGISGWMGGILTGVLSQKAYGGIMQERGSWLEGNWIQVPVQVLGLISASIWSYVISYIILYLFNKIPCLKLGVDAETQLRGLDEPEMGTKSFEAICVCDKFNVESRTERGKF